MPAIPLMNPAVKAALDALQRGDRSAWKSLFTRDTELFDDGRPRSLTEFSDEAVGHAPVLDPTSRGDKLPYSLLSQ